MKQQICCFFYEFQFQTYVHIGLSKEGLIECTLSSQNILSLKLECEQKNAFLFESILLTLWMPCYSKSKKAHTKLLITCRKDSQEYKGKIIHKLLISMHCITRSTILLR